MLNTDNTKPLAYSYVRFSSAQQASGDSLRRQVERTERYCQEHGLTLASDAVYRDLGVSAFRGKNVETGELAEFIAAVKCGEIPPGSHLIVEHFDRLSREEVGVALELFLALVDAGIVVVTLTDGKVWDKESVADGENLRTAISYMSSAHDESRRLSVRISSAWVQKKKHAADGTATRILTAEAPRWLRANADKSGFDIIPALAESVSKVFEMRIKGAGSVAICRRANEERWPVPGKAPVQQREESDEDFAQRIQVSGRWPQSLVGRILNNRAVLGEYQPHHINPETGKREALGDPIPGYYPAIVDETTFLQAVDTTARRGRYTGRRDVQGRNWLFGLVKCACGNSLVRKNKTSTKQPYSRFYCSGRVRGGTTCESVNSTRLESLVGYAATSWLSERWPGGNTPDIGSIENFQTRLRQIAQEMSAIAAGRGGRDSALALREELARVFQKIVIHQADGYVEFFVVGRAEPVWLPLDFVSLEPPCEPTEEQMEQASSDSDALRP